MNGLTPIGTVVEFFDLPLSTLHYWERRGLIAARRVAGRRCYDGDQLVRISLIRLWRTTGLMSLDEIATLLGERGSDRDWRDTVTGRIDAVDRQVEQLRTAKHYLEHLLGCQARDGLEHCVEYRSTVRLP